MQTPYHIIKLLENDNSILVKKSIVKQAADEKNVEFFEGVRYAYDNMITFGVKKVPEHSGPDGTGLVWIEFVKLAQQLRHRQLTGHAARDAIACAMALSTQEEWNFWYRRILIKDLRCGTSDTIVNSVLKDSGLIQYMVPVFECQLAHDGAKHEKKLIGKKLIDHKCDGVRCLTVIDAENGTVTQYSRNGQVLENFSHITDALQQNIELFERSWVLDGEMMSDDFQTLMTQVKRKKDVNASDSVLHLFDIIPLSEFRKGVGTMGQRRRSVLLQSFIPIFNNTGCIKVIIPEEVDLDTAVGQLQFDGINQTAIENGYEGIMVKNPDGLYECKRSTNWLKIKPFISVDLSIVSVEEGTGKHAGRLGAIVCDGEDQGRQIHVNVGSGITDEERQEWWDSRDSLTSQVVEIRADAVTQNQDGTYSLRFPRFIRFRGFSAGQKI